MSDSRVADAIDRVLQAEREAADAIVAAGKAAEATITAAREARRTQLERARQRVVRMDERAQQMLARRLQALDEAGAIELGRDQDGLDSITTSAVARVAQFLTTDDPP